MIQNKKLTPEEIAEAKRNAKAQERHERRSTMVRNAVYGALPYDEQVRVDAQACDEGIRAARADGLIQDEPAGPVPGAPWAGTFVGQFWSEVKTRRDRAWNDIMRRVYGRQIMAMLDAQDTGYEAPRTSQDAREVVERIGQRVA